MTILFFLFLATYIQATPIQRSTNDNCPYPICAATVAVCGAVCSETLGTACVACLGPLTAACSPCFRGAVLHRTSNANTFIAQTGSCCTGVGSGYGSCGGTCSICCHDGQAAMCPAGCQPQCYCRGG